MQERHRNEKERKRVKKKRKKRKEKLAKDVGVVVNRPPWPPCPPPTSFTPALSNWSLFYVFARFRSISHRLSRHWFGRPSSVLPGFSYRVSFTGSLVPVVVWTSNGFPVGSTGFSRDPFSISTVLAEFHLVLPSFRRFYWVLRRLLESRLGFAEANRVLPSSTKVNRVQSWFYLFLPSFPRFY